MWANRVPEASVLRHHHNDTAPHTKSTNHWSHVLIRISSMSRVNEPSRFYRCPCGSRSTSSIVQFYIAQRTIEMRIIDKPFSPRTTLQDFLNVLSAILECSFLIMQLLFEFCDVLLQCRRFAGKTLIEGINGHGDKHLANSFVNRIIFGQSTDLGGSQLIQSGFSFLRIDFRLCLCNLLL